MFPPGIGDICEASTNFVGDGLSAVTDESLALGVEDMRRLGYAVIDAIVERHAGLGGGPLINTPDGSNPGIDLADRPIPQHPQDPVAALRTVEAQVLSDVKPVSDPRFFGYIPGPSNFVGAMADALVSGFNVFAGTANYGHGPAQVEARAIRWLCDLAGLPPEAGGTFVSGGSVGNLSALALARHRLLQDNTDGARIYCSQETHSSIERGLKILGFAPGQLVQLPCDGGLRIDPAALEARIGEDRAAGQRPFLIVANAGTTSTGAVDPLSALADISEAQGLWLHVDGAYGGAALLSPRKRESFAGIDRAHSITMDQHKWFFQPFECASLLVREMDWLRDMFFALPAYLKDSAKTAEGVNYRDYGVQLTRGLRALKLWMSLEVFGERAFQAAVEHGLAMAEHVQSRLETDARWRVMAPATLAIVAFRYQHAGMDEASLDGLNDRINRELVESGCAFTTTTEVKGRKSLRLCTINPRITPELLDDVLSKMGEIGDRLSA